jgi:hypothetical protein
VKVLETRRPEPGVTRRRYLLDDGRRMSTIELPVSVLSVFGKPKLRAAIEAWQRGEARRERAVVLRQRVLEGVKPTAIAHELGVTEARVRQVRDEIRRGAVSGEAR